MKLLKFKVIDFRSVKDSGWVEAENVTALIGVNESGKTNLLLPLWKLNPVREGEIQPTSDYPKAMFGEIREHPENYKFIIAEFNTEDLSGKIAALAGIPKESASIVRVSRYYDGRYKIEFPLYHQDRTFPSKIMLEMIKSFQEKINQSSPLKQEESFKASVLSATVDLAGSLSTEGELPADRITEINDRIQSLLPKDPAKTSVLVPLVLQYSDELLQIIDKITSEAPDEKEELVEFVTSEMPKFVYYSNYGNLDSEIYLPHVVENLDREDLGAKESAKARTLRVLFTFVRLHPQEILELGRDFRDQAGRRPTEDELAKITESKRTRSILLQSAGTLLTKEFKEWWKQGDYRFRFEADGSHFRIWVSDDRRPQEVELENRSTGLQWFLSFYLVFLVESVGQHKKAILLLDEPGISLHPHAQRNLSAFFDNLSRSNQLIYTSHSPFLVDADRLERARKVFIAEDGSTKATSDLRHAEGADINSGAAYAVHSALNLSVAESLLVGCQPIIVEGTSDQFYLTAIKSLLVSAKKIAPSRELVFPPSGGTKTARVVASILTGRDEQLPFILLDADSPGKRMAKELASGLYAHDSSKIISVGDFIAIEDAEIEDLLPPALLAGEMDRIEREPDTRLTDVIKEGIPFVKQVESWAASQSVTLRLFWKVELAKRVKQRLLFIGIDKIDSRYIKAWVELFDKFMPTS